MARAASRRAGSARVRGLSRVPGPRGRRHRRGAVDRELHRHRPACGRARDPRGRSRAALDLPGPRTGRAAAPGERLRGNHPLCGDAHHGAPPGRRGERAGRAQGGGRPVPAVRPAGDAGGRRGGRSARGGARAPRRRVGGAGGSRARGSPGRRRRRRALGRRNRLRGARDHRARARPGRLRGAVRVLAPGSREPRRTRGHAVAARGEPRLSPVRGAPRAGGAS